MIRRLALLAGLGALVLTALPMATALAFEAGAAAQGSADTDVPTSFDGLDLRVAANASSDSLASAGILAPTRGFDEVGIASGADDSSGVIPPMDPHEAAAAFAGLSVLVGLGLYYWGQIKFAALAAMVPLFSRIQPNRMLDNEVRNRVHGAVQENPGVTIKEIVGLCAIGWGTAVYHLKRLEHERLIVSERHRQFRRYYKNGGGIANGSKSAYAELKSPTGQRIAASILSTPGRCQKELCEVVGISPPLAHKYLSRLQSAGLVEAQREWKTVKYFPTAQLQDLFSALRGPAAVELAAPPIAFAAA